MFARFVPVRSLLIYNVKTGKKRQLVHPRLWRGKTDCILSMLWSCRLMLVV